MSEFSDSFHFREKTRRSLSALRKSGLRGLAFPPKGGWRTFVPFDHEQPVGAALSEAISDRVLHYFFAEDHGWGFEIWDNGSRVCAYSCSWPGDDLIVDDEGLRIDAVASWLSKDASVNGIADLLRPASLESVFEQRPAYRFARALGLASFEWLGPETVTADFEILSRARGFSVIGTPPSRQRFDAPPISRLDLTTTEISAKEAVRLLMPPALLWAPDARVYGVASAGAVMDKDEREIKGAWIQGDGLSANHGGWVVSFASDSKHLWTHISLRATGSVEARSGPLTASARMESLPAQWLDSPAVTAITETLFQGLAEKDTPPLFDRVLQVYSSGGRAEWNVRYICNAPFGKVRADFHFRLDAETGELLEQSHDVVDLRG